ncbi:hypothetical protein [Vibrio harveyi]|uniref:hypothetical protein n=1 Tax=Vibrio harveyi TaxID=669 RepID=UPI00217EF404|nr:hypothetical protein [Vibrio harveyi]
MAQIIITIEQNAGIVFSETGFAIPLHTTIEVEGCIGDNSDVIPLAIADKVANVYAQTLKQGVDAAMQQVMKDFANKNKDGRND